MEKRWLRRALQEEVLLVPDKLRQDRVFALSSRLFLVSVTMLLIEMSVSLA